VPISRSTPKHAKTPGGGAPLIAKADATRK
jgi:hypothetical protein